MATEKSFELLDALTGRESESFEKYLDSPFFRVPEPVRELYSLMTVQGIRHRKSLFGQLYPGKRYDDKRLRYLLSALNHSIEEFFSYRALQKDSLTGMMLLSSTLSNRSCNKAYRKIHRDIQQMESAEDEAHRFYVRYTDELHALRLMMKESTRKQSPDYVPILENLDTFYMLSRLRIACEATNISNILAQKIEMTLLDSLLPLAEKPPYNKVPHIRIYSLIYRMLTHPEKETFFTATGKLLRDEGHFIHPSELGDLYQYLKNYCVRRVNSGDTSYVRVLFELYLDILANKSLMRHDYLSQFEFKNMVTISLRLGETGWCEKFIKRYINHLRPEDRKNTLAYNTAYLYFMKADYHRAISKLQEVEMTDVFYQLDARVILLKSYFELDETDSFFYQASAFRLFLLRNKNISEFQKTIYRNLIKYLSAIVRSYGSRAKLKKIRAAIETNRNVADLNWLLQKIQEQGA